MSETVKRSWGSYTVINQGSDFKTKILEFEPGKSLSLQRHFAREELWMFLEGSGIMTVTKEHKDAWKTAFNVCAGTFIWIAKERVHSFVAKEPTKIMEVQLGVCEEEDIMRYPQPEAFKGILVNEIV